MAGQARRKVEGCLAFKGLAFRVKPVEKMGLKWCRICGYQNSVHEQIAREMVRDATRLNMVAQRMKLEVSVISTRLAGVLRLVVPPPEIE